jgi:asparagine synthase (glutamine-hydrolysing)
MCGISGIALASRSKRRPDEATLRRMSDVAAHRGPDDSGVFLDASVGLGHRRLSIVDLAAGRQPMSNEDGSIQIVFNGEIYNHADHRTWLEACGHRYRTHCDTETILHLYEEKGEQVVSHLRGMFAFAIWDQRRKELLLARDRLGVKPLYYIHSEDGALYFGSEIKSLLAADALKPELNFAALPGYLANHATYGEETLFRGVRRLLPGHTLRWRDGEVQIRRYWDVEYAPEAEPERNDRDYIARWSELFEEAVRLRLMADVPLGMFLSGGIDSSAIAAVMSRMVPDPIKTFSVAFAEREANELHYARLVAQAFQTDHHEVVVSPHEFFAALPRMIWHEDEPLAHPSSVALYFVSQLAAQHVKVVLTGEGSDESLAGYERYRKTIYNLGLGQRYHRWTPAPIRRGIRSGIGKMSPLSRTRQKLARSFLCLAPDLESLYFDNFAVFSRVMQQQLLTAETKERIGCLDPYLEIEEMLSSTDAGTLLNRLLYADTKTYLHELLMKQDQMSMAASIESRVPFLDHQLIEFTARMPERMKLRGWTTKYVLRQSMKGVLPEPILRRSKMGFPVPVGAWFRGAYSNIIEEYVLSERALSRGIFDPSFVRALAARHQAGENHAERLWALVNFEIWMRQAIEATRISELEYSK